MGAAFGRPCSGYTRARHARSHLAVVRGKPELAMAWLEVARHAVVPGAEITTDFLRMTGQLAERQQRDAVALDAYRQLLTTPDAELPDFDSAIRLLQVDSPIAGGRCGGAGLGPLLPAAPLDPGPDDLCQPQPVDAGQASAGQGEPHHRHRTRSDCPLWKDAQFLRIVGLYHQNTGNLTRAAQLFDAALRLAPDSAEMRQAIVWLFIDSNDNISAQTAGYP